MDGSDRSIESQEARQRLGDHYRRLLTSAFEQADAGGVADWDIEQTIASARQRFMPQVEN
jgi:hypothetical protein